MSAMRDDMVAIKGIKDGLLITLDDGEEWQVVINDLTARIDARSEFFDGANITVDVGSRPLPKYQLRTLKAALERRGLSVGVILSESQTTIDSAIALDMRTTAGLNIPSAHVKKDEDVLPQVNPEEEDLTPGVMIRKTLRSGRIVRSEGHVIVYGDVNPGAQIVAAGDVIIWGVLRGSVHAGAYGDENAIICALDMIPAQMRIGEQIADLPRNIKRRKVAPEVAFVRDNTIVIDSWNR